MDNESRKNEIRRRITIARYPRRSRAVFTDENDHNPLVLQDCPTCDGSGKASEYWSEGEISVHSRIICPTCHGTGITGEIEPFFAIDTPEASVATGVDGWITCPNCRWRFTTVDPNAWTGRRHMRCGQKIKVISSSPRRETK